MTSVGDQLRRERIRQGIDLASLARDTRINQKYLEAIEAGDPAPLPGGFFYRSFVRQYALALGMDAHELEAELDRVREAEAPVLSAALQDAKFPLKAPDPIVTATNRRLASGRTWGYVLLLVGVLAGCSAIYSWWHRLESPEPKVTAAVESKPAAAVVPAASPAASSPAPAAPAPAPATEPASAADSDKVVLSVTVKEKTWLSITSDGRPIFSGILEPSETKVLGGKERARIRVGNAGGLEITWNGKQIGPIGSRGQVRTVLFTPENFQILPVGGSL